jgi:hypothetical protein
MNSGRTAVAIALLASAVTVNAEVRLVPHASAAGARIRVQPTSAGPWTVLGAQSDLALNPRGDARGDRYPAVATSDDGALVVWTRGSGDVGAAFGSVRWSSELDIPSGSAIGTPVVHALDHGWIVAWQQAGPVPTIAVAAATRDGRISAGTTIDCGQLVGILNADGDRAHVVALAPDGTLVDRLITFSFLPPGEPIPIPVSVWRTTVGVLAAGASLDSVRLLEGARHGQAYALVAWWMSPSSLASVRLNEQGSLPPASTITARGGSSYSESLIEEATRNATGR